VWCIEEQKQTKTGTCDTPENLAENSVKIQKNKVKSSKGEICKEKSSSNVKSCKNKSLSNQKQMRVLGLEPKTYGLKGQVGNHRCLPSLYLCAFFARQY
jgi:hypothetical protein